MSPAAREAVRLLAVYVFLPAGRTLAAVVGAFVAVFAAGAAAGFHLYAGWLRWREVRRG